MAEASDHQTGLRLGLVILGGVALVFAGIVLFGPKSGGGADPTGASAVEMGLLDILSDDPTHQAIDALSAAAPATFAQLDADAKRAIQSGEDGATLSAMVLEALFAQFSDQAYHLQFAGSDDYQAILAGFSTGLRRMKMANSDWCSGARIAKFLAQDDDELVPSLLSEFPYQSPQYEWVMEWMATVLTVSKSAQDQPVRYAKPGFRDEAMLQQEGLAIGSEQWSLALQIAAFANSEGVSYGKMQEVVSGMDVCELGIAVETVSGRLPADVRGRIWADLMPEIMVGNTPYAMWRITDYFFIN